MRVRKACNALLYKLAILMILGEERNLLSDILSVPYAPENKVNGGFADIQVKLVTDVPKIHASLFLHSLKYLTLILVTENWRMHSQLSLCP